MTADHTVDVIVDPEGATRATCRCGWGRAQHPGRSSAWVTEAAADHAGTTFDDQPWADGCTQCTPEAPCIDHLNPPDGATP